MSELAKKGTSNKEESIELAIKNAYKINSMKDIGGQYAPAIRIGIINTAVDRIKQYYPDVNVDPFLGLDINLQFDKNPKLAECTISSLFGAIQQMVSLELTPKNEEVYLIPYGKDVQLQIGYKGYQALCHRAGVTGFEADVVYEDDEFIVRRGRVNVCDHIHNYRSNKRNPENIIAAYAKAFLPNGEYVFKVLDRAQIEKRRLTSPMQKGAATGAWTFYESMAAAKAAKALAKSLPRTPELTLLEKTSLIDSQVIHRNIEDEKLKEFDHSEYNPKLDDEYSEEFEASAIVDEDKDEINKLIEKDAGK